MKLWTKVLALLLAVSLTVTAMPITSLAADVVNEAEPAVTEETEAASEQPEEETEGQKPAEKEDENSSEWLEDETTQEEGGEVKPVEVEEEPDGTGEEEQQETEKVEEEQQETEKAADVSRTVVEEYTTMTVGQELHQTTGQDVAYLFAPEESGYYRLLCESIGGQEARLQNVKTIYYTEDETGERTQHEISYGRSAAGGKIERLMWLNGEEQYVFSCRANTYYVSDQYDFKIQMDKVEIESFETAQNPTKESYDFLNCEGMQVRVNYSDGSSTVSETNSSTYGYGCQIKALEWQSVAHNGKYLSGYAQLVEIDGAAWNGDFSSLANGQHTAVLRTVEYGQTDPAAEKYDFEMEFTVKKGNVESLEVQNPRTEYTEGFCEQLGEFQLLVKYNDGTEDAIISSSDRDVRAYFVLSDESTTSNIDDYLTKGGKVGEAEATVSYRGASTTYKIAIAENPYERMEITPKRTIYYAGCGFQSGDSDYSADSLSGDFGITMYRKDGKTESYDNWYNLPNYSVRGAYGLTVNDSYYCKYIDSFISAGGAIGQQTVEVSYCGITGSYEITIQENPYDHITIAEQPQKRQYLHGKYEILDLQGLVIHAYKNDTDYDVYRYQDYMDYERNTGTMTSEQYEIMRRLFYSRLGGHESIQYLEPGTHTVSLYLMGHKAEYEIEVVEKMAEALTIVQAPERLSYYANGKTNGWFYRGLSGLIIEIKGLDGQVTKYKYGYNPAYDEDGDSEYGNWKDIDGGFSYDDSAVDWSRAGNYTVALSYLGAEDAYEITIQEDPVKELKITKMPDKTSYYQYETGMYDLKGMEYQVVFRDGTAYSGKVQEEDSREAYFTYKGERFHMPSQWNVTFNGAVKLGDNAIVVSAFGAKAVTNTITVREDPVKSLEVVKNPEKMQYIARDNRVDLYGMELQITYVDGVSEKIVVTEHGSGWEVKNECGGMITSYLTRQWIDGKERRVLRIQYRNVMGYMIQLPDVDWSALNPVKLEEEGFCHTVLTEDIPYCVYSFTPSETREYHFFSVSGRYAYNDAYADLYKGNQLVASNCFGGENGNFRISCSLQAGSTYYYVVSKYNFGATGTFDCCLSSAVKSLSELEVTDVTITKPGKVEYYDFESDHVYADSLSLEGTECQITYSNGWKRTEMIESSGTQISFGENTLSVKWKYTVWDEWGDEECVDKERENALIYTYNGREMEFPIRFDVPGPVDSLTVTANPWKDRKVYEYQTEDLTGNGLSVLIHYNDGREDETVTWKDSYSSYFHNGYRMRVDWKDEVQLGENKIVLSYMGKVTEIPVTVSENPVKSIQTIQLPEKTAYYPFEKDDDYIDLYGMELLIAYKDGTEQRLKVSEHGNRVEVPGAYGETLEARVRYAYDGDDNETEVCFVRYMGCRQDIMPYAVKKFYVEDSIPMTADEEKQASLGEGVNYQIFSFVPSETGNYRFQYSPSSGDNYIRIYSAAGKYLTRAWRSYLDYEMTGGKRYYVALIAETAEAQSLICTITRQPDRVREKIGKVDLTLSNPTAGSWLADMYDYDYDEYSVVGYQWMNDEGDDERADYGTAHRLKLVLSPYRNYQFTVSTQVMVNGKKVASKSLGSDGKLTLYYTFPYTQCKISIPEIDGYELDESQNENSGVCNYGEDYRFRYIKQADNVDSGKLIIKAGNKVLYPDNDGYYVIGKVMENIAVTAKTDKLTAGYEESKLTFYNKSTEIFDIITGKRNGKVADNVVGENSFPVLDSYVDGSDQFFFGWYLGKDEDVNGKGTRFTSQSALENAAYDLYAKWGSGLFTYIMNNKLVNCKILSIDEYNRTRVQVGDGSNKARAADMGLMQLGRAADDGAFVIPETIDLESSAELKALGIDFGEAEVIAIAEHAFEGESGIKNISLPKTIEYIGSGAFAGCAELETVEIPEGVSVIGNDAFSGCENLQAVSIPSTVSAVAEGTFQGCTNLTNVYLAEGVSEIGAGAFEGCTNLKTVTLPDCIETVDETAFDANPNLTIICSSEMKDSDMVQSLKETTGATVVAVDVTLNYDYDEKQFTYGDSAQTFSAEIKVDGKTVSDREVAWIYPETTAYTFTLSDDKRSLTVKPERITSSEEQIVIQAKDKETGKSASILLRTNGIELNGRDNDGDDLYSIQKIENQVYTGKEIRPQVTLVNNITGEEVGAENYDVSYSNNIQAGTAYVKITGKGIYSGSVSSIFAITKAEQVIIIKGGTDIVKTVGDVPFVIEASTTGDGLISFQSSDTKVATIGDTPADKGKVNIVGTGTTEITITASGTSNCNIAEKKVRLTVKAKGAVSTEQKNQTITASDITRTYGDPDFKVGASTTGDGVLSYSSSNLQVITVDSKNGTVKIVGAGTADITIKAAATSAYSEAVKTINVTIRKADAGLKISKKSYKKIYGDKAFKLSASAKTAISYKSSNKKVADYKKGKINIKGCGTATITVSAGNANYAKVSKKVTIKVLPKKASVKKLVSKKSRQITVAWKRQKEAAGYVVEYTTDRKFKKKVKKVEIKKNTTTSTTIKKLSGGKKYYVRVKAYTKINKKKQFGSAGKVQNVKVKR